MQVEHIVGQNIRTMRAMRGVSQAALARALDVDRATLNHIERLNRGINTTTLTKICRSLHVSADVLLGLQPLPEYVTAD